MSPVRIQRQRTKGWSMPEGAIYVGRPSRWGNPYAVGDRCTVIHSVAVEIAHPDWRTGDGITFDLTTALAHYASDAAWIASVNPGFYAPLRGKDLACWCPLDQPCHADVLLDLANAA